MHISLDQALGRQPRLNRVGQSLLNIGEDAAAAYSLRSLNGGDPKVVNVRRSADDEEREFTASGVNAELENWVNGKLETTLPADVDTAAAAYSLRKVRSAYTGKAVQIRRVYDNVEVDVDFDENGEVSDSSLIYNVDEETDDTGIIAGLGKASGTATLGEFIDQTDTSRLPCDQADAAAAYSLRKVREAYTGDVVKIRRESDDAEADVAFDDNDEVSTSSAITVTSGSSTAATLGEFIDSEKTGRINFASGSNNWLSYDDSSSIFSNSLFGNGTIRSAYNHITDLDGIGASPVSDSDYSFKVDSATGTSGHGVTIGANSRDYSYTCTFKYYVPVGQPNIQVVYGLVSSGSLSVKGQWEEVTVSSDASQGHRDFLIRSAAHASTGGIWYLADINLEISSYKTSVVTWYDQSGNNNHATQTDGSKQPKIAEGGTYLGELDFDGTDDFLQFSAADVGNNDVISAFLAATGPTVGNSTALGSSLAYPIRRDGPNRVVSLTNANTFRLDGTDFTYSNGNTRLVTLIRDLSVPSSLLALDGDVQDTIAASYQLENTYQIGAKRSGSTYVGFADFECKELIVYATNQTLNRSYIEKNIGDHYGITVPDVSQDIAVVTWYDQSGNGNDATQDTAASQPLIAEGGSLLTDSNNQPIIDFLDDSVTGFNISNSISPESIFAVVDIKNISGTQRIFEKGGNNGIIIESNQANFRFNNTTNRLVSSASGKQLLTGIDGPSGLTAKNGTEVITSGITTSFDSGSNYRIGVLNFTGTTQAYGGHMYELIIYPSDQSSNRFKIESNINNHYGIYTAAEDGFVETWFDQSGNGNDATQGTLASQPNIVSNGSLLNDIDFAGDTFLQATSLQEQVPVSFFCVNRFDSTLSGFRPFLGNGILDSSSTGYGMFYHDPSNTFRTQVRIPSASSNVDNTATTVGDVKALTTSFITASTLTSFYNGGNESSSANAQGAVTPNRTLTIGGSETGVTPTVTRFFNGGISEVVLYSTDQSSNRPAIESNMADEYGITLS